MEDSQRESLLQAGVELTSALDRFLGNEELLLRFLRQFPEDPNYGLFKTAMEEKRYKDAFKAAHTFKGVCGNLSLAGLFQVVSKEVELLRSDSYPQAEELFPELVQEYERCVGILRAI